MTFDELVLTCPTNVAIMDSFCKAHQVINMPKYEKILCSISGGYDSDVILDICTKVDEQYKIDYIWFDTGLEYDATKEHLLLLQKKYGIEIISIKAKKSIPVSCKKYGLPFLSKYVSEMIYRLQKHEFKWEDSSYNELVKIYPKCQSALRWWTNEGGAQPL